MLCSAAGHPSLYPMLRRRILLQPGQRFVWDLRLWLAMHLGLLRPMLGLASHVWARRLSRSLSETFGRFWPRGRASPPAGQTSKGQGRELTREVQCRILVGGKHCEQVATSLRAQNAEGRQWTFDVTPTRQY